MNNKTNKHISLSTDDKYAIGREGNLCIYAVSIDRINFVFP